MASMMLYKMFLKSRKKHQIRRRQVHTYGIHKYQSQNWIEDILNIINCSRCGV